MIRIIRPDAPEILQTRGVAAMRKLCDAYDRGERTFTFQKSLYAASQVKSTLLAAQHRKCAFCESFFQHTGYGDIEHFRPKAGYMLRQDGQLQRPGYYWLAYEWKNLLYSCQICNQRHKRNLFPLHDNRKRARSHRHSLVNEKPLLIDPGSVEPGDFLVFSEEFVKPRNGCKEGATTIQALGLNHEDLVEERRKRLDDLKVLVDLCHVLRAATPEPHSSDLVAKISQCEAMLTARTHLSGEYTAMARAYLSPSLQ